jgi:negative regulator of sigma E activity
MSHETLSALLDGECSAGELDQLLEEIEHSPALKEQWSRLCLARHAREGTHFAKDQPCLCAGVMAGLDQQPAELDNPKVVELRRPRPAFNWKPLAGLAAAASVAVVALLVGVTSSPQPGAALAGTAQGAPLTEPVSYPVAPHQARNLQNVALHADAEQPWQDAGDDLDNYLSEHNSSLAGQGVGMGGPLRSARFAAYSAIYHPEGQP